MKQTRDFICQLYAHYTAAFDYTIGGSIGLWTGLKMYWEHFWQEEWMRVVDGSIGTVVNTIIGAFVLHFIHKVVKRNSK